MRAPGNLASFAVDAEVRISLQRRNGRLVRRVHLVPDSHRFVAEQDTRWRSCARKLECRGGLCRVVEVVVKRNVDEAVRCCCVEQLSVGWLFQVHDVVGEVEVAPVAFVPRRVVSAAADCGIASLFIVTPTSVRMEHEQSTTWMGCSETNEQIERQKETLHRGKMGVCNIHRRTTLQFVDVKKHHFAVTHPIEVIDKCKDVVVQHVLDSVVLVKRPALGVMCNIFGDVDTAARLVCVESPPARLSSMQGGKLRMQCGCIYTVLIRSSSPTIQGT